MLDLTGAFAGPWCAQRLADFGADVIKIERRGAGDDTRQWGPPYFESSDGMTTREAAYYLAANPITGNTAVDEFLAAFDRIEAETSVRGVIITGAGTAFSSGGNIQEMERQSAGDISGMEIRRDYRRGIQRLPLALFNLEVPVIAAVNGPAIGAGLDPACACDLRIASESARFAESFLKLGIIPGDGGAWLLPRIVGLSRAAEMTFTGSAIDSRKALEWNLVSQVVPADQLLAAATELAEAIAANPPHGVRMAKRLLGEGMHTRLDTLLELSAGFQVIAHQTADRLRACLGHSASEVDCPQ